MPPTRTSKRIRASAAANSATTAASKPAKVPRRATPVEQDVSLKSMQELIMSTLQSISEQMRTHSAILNNKMGEMQTDIDGIKLHLNQVQKDVEEVKEDMSITKSNLDQAMIELVDNQYKMKDVKKRLVDIQVMVFKIEPTPRIVNTSSCAEARTALGLTTSQHLTLNTFLQMMAANAHLSDVDRRQMLETMSEIVRRT